VFEHCSAYVIASEIEWQSRLSYIMRQVGFSECIRLSATRSILPRHPTHLPFFFIHSNANKALAVKTVNEVRANGDDTVRFMPIIMLTDEMSERTIRKFMTLGCDDIILFPCTAPLLAQRLRLQVDKQRDYFQTTTYFGPDRRRSGSDNDHPERRDGKGSTYRHIEIKRDIRGGVKVLSTKTFKPEPQADTVLNA